jgi:hypothetical protein
VATLAAQRSASDRNGIAPEPQQTPRERPPDDRLTLLELMERIGVSRNPVKQATGWVAETVSRAKFNGTVSGEQEQGAFLTLESLVLRVKGKASMWKA